MRTARLLLLLVFAVPALAPLSHAEPPRRVPVLDQALVAQVTGIAFGFMAPRMLDAVPIPQLALWGLRGLTRIDPRLAVELRDPGKTGAPLLLTGSAGRVLLSVPAPAEADATLWGATVAQTMRAAWDGSGTVRRSGTQVLISGFFDALFSHLDPYSRYAPPLEAAAERARRNGSAGVGLAVTLRGGGFVADTVQSGSPAAQAGIRPGDRLLAVDDEPMQGVDPTAVAAMLAGPEQSDVDLLVRGRDGRERTVTLERELISPETVFAERQGDMLVLRISGFSRATAARLAQELIRGTADMPPVLGVVLDLRGNRGGVLQQAVATAAMVQATGVVAVTEGRDPEAAHVFLADGRDLARFLPVVVLVDRASASAAEILAASLADQHRAVVVGSATLGKGLVQTVTTLPDGGELLISWSRVLAPLGWPLQSLGVLPQVCTSLGPDILARQLAALASGVQPMASILARHRAARAPLPPAETEEIRAACPPADGRDADLGTARYLIDTPSAYAAALLDVVRPGLTQAGVSRK